MPKGVPVLQDLETMIFLVIKERRIALPTSRLIWYAKWFNIPCQPANVRKTIQRMVREGTLVEVRDGRYRYYKIGVRK